jgi:cysteine desulfurase/selenocysteine lyase
MPVYMGGGEMIQDVTFEKTTYNDLPYKFEAGTPNIADVIAFHNALDFVNEMGREEAQLHEDEILQYAQKQLSQVGGIRLIGTAKHKAGVLSFLINGAHPQDVGVLLDQQGIAVRTGHHCTQPLMNRLGIPGTVRASFAMYNTKEEVDAFVKAVLKAKKMLV